MRLTTRQKISAGFAAAVLILIVGALSFRSTRRAMDAARWVAHTHQVLERLDALLTALVDVETGQRGYVITGEARYLQPYDAGMQRVEAHVAAVRQLTADNPRQQARLDSLAPLIAARLDVAREIVARRRTDGFAPAAALVVTDRGKVLMDDIRRRINAMQVEERTLLAGRTGERVARERWAVAVAIVGAIVAFVLVALMIRVIQQDLQLLERTAVERDAHMAQEQRARSQLAAIQHVTDAALAPLALDDLLTQLMRRLREVLSVDTACVLLVMRDGEHLELCKCVGPTEEIKQRIRIPVGRGVEGRIASDRAPIAVGDVAAADVYDPVVRERFASLLGAPLIVPARTLAGAAVGVSVGPLQESATAPGRFRARGSVPAAAREQVIGVVHVETLAPRQFTEAELDLLTLVAERAASAIERARLHQAERRSEERFRLLVEGVQDYAIFMLDPAGRVASWNAGAHRLKGYTAEDIIGESFARFYTPEDRADGLPERGLASASTEGRFHNAGWRLRKDGSLFWADVVITALRDEDDGHLLGFAKITRDLTERKRAEEALTAAKEGAEAANAAKSQFLATMSHEIRTPINAVLGYVDLLDLGLDGPMNEVQRGRLARIRASGRHLIGLVNELLDLAKIEAHQLRVERVRASASEAAATALALVFPQANARGLAMSNRCVTGADAAYMGDPHRVEQVLANLLSNAVKFNMPGGRVDVECGITETPSPGARLVVSEDGGRDCWCYVRVSDTGPGIAPEHREAVFEPFVQADTGANPYTREHGGTGLGLAISRRLARLMGGDVTLDNDRGAGTTFTLWLPAPPDIRPVATGEPAGCTTDERRKSTREVRGFRRSGHVLRDGAADLLMTHVRRLRTELRPELVVHLSDTELEDHIGTLIAELARALVLIEDAGGDTSQALRDGTEIQRVLAERHGAQRGALGWSQADHQREIAILREDIERSLRGAVPSREGDAPTDLEGAMAVISRMLAHAERAGERARRRAGAE